MFAGVALCLLLAALCGSGSAAASSYPGIKKRLATLQNSSSALSDLNLVYQLATLRTPSMTYDSFLTAASSVVSKRTPRYDTGYGGGSSGAYGRASYEGDSHSKPSYGGYYGARPAYNNDELILPLLILLERREEDRRIRNRNALWAMSMNDNGNNNNNNGGFQQLLPLIFSAGPMLTQMLPGVGLG